MLIFQIEVNYEFVTKMIKSSDQKFVKCSKLKILLDFWHFLSFWIFCISDLQLSLVKNTYQNCDLKNCYLKDNLLSKFHTF